MSCIGESFKEILWTMLAQMFCRTNFRCISEHLISLLGRRHSKLPLLSPLSRLLSNFGRLQVHHFCCLALIVASLQTKKPCHCITFNEFSQSSPLFQLRIQTPCPPRLKTKKKKKRISEQRFWFSLSKQYVILREKQNQLLLSDESFL